MDAESDRVLAEAWPNVSRFHWPVKCLQNPFNYGEGAYQLFYLFRANFAAALLHKGRSFWMVQQDTFWRENLLSLNLSSTDSDILFDRADGTMGTMIAGRS
uniref:Nucleotide-diphospho-sugar transferase domain-containing protein n=1 Tax=Plectus sambesii TaxID=2011161 RepID=A0A914ULN1_9BILA